MACNTCVYFHARGWLRSDALLFGECRRRAPTMPLDERVNLRVVGPPNRPEWENETPFRVLSLGYPLLWGYDKGCGEYQHAD